MISIRRCASGQPRHSRKCAGAQSEFAHQKDGTQGRTHRSRAAKTPRRYGQTGRIRRRSRVDTGRSNTGGEGHSPCASVVEGRHRCKEFWRRPRGRYLAAHFQVGASRVNRGTRRKNADARNSIAEVAAALDGSLDGLVKALKHDKTLVRPAPPKRLLARPIAVYPRRRHSCSRLPITSKLSALPRPKHWFGPVPTK